MIPKKSLGQNFLTSIPARLAIAEAGHLTASDTVLEIGPGKGFLTRALLDTGAKVIALEKDRDLIPLLTELCASEVTTGKLVIHEADALTFDPRDVGLETGTYKLIANIPYYITGAILSRYLSEVNQPASMVVLVQKEVAERVCARDGKESLLSLSVKAYGEPKIVYRVSRGSFHPVPNVDSAVLRVSNISRIRFKNTYHEEMFFKTIHAGFAHKRKFLTSNLKIVFPEAHLENLFEQHSISSKARAEDVTLPTWISLAQALC